MAKVPGLREAHGDGHESKKKHATGERALGSLGIRDAAVLRLGHPS